MMNIYIIKLLQYSSTSIQMHIYLFKASCQEPKWVGFMITLQVVVVVGLTFETGDWLICDWSYHKSHVAKDEMLVSSHCPHWKLSDHHPDELPNLNLNNASFVAVGRW
jgi:hypothetical protein